MTSNWLKQLKGEAFYERRWKKEQRALGRIKPQSLKSKVSEQTQALASLSKDVLARARTNPFELLNLAPSGKEASSSPRLSGYAEWDHGASKESLCRPVCSLPKHTYYIRNRQADPSWGPLRVVNPDRGSRCSSLCDSATDFLSNALQALSPFQQQSFTVLESALPRRLTTASRGLTRTSSSLKHRVENGRRLARLAGKFLSNSDFNGESELPRLLLRGLQLPASKPKLPRLLTVDADHALFGSVAARGASRGSSLGLPLSTFGGPQLSPSDLCLPTCKIWVPYRVSDVAPQLPPLFDGLPLSPLGDLEATPESLPRFDNPLLSPEELFLGLPRTSDEPNPEVQGNFQCRNVTQPQVQKANLHLFLAKQKCEPWVERQNGNTAHGNFGTALGSACSGLRYSSAHFEPQFSSQPSPSARNPWTALRNLKFLADDYARHPDLESELADDLLYLSTLEFRELRFGARKFHLNSAPRSYWSLSEAPVEDEVLSSPSPQDFTQGHLSGRNAPASLRGLHTKHQELLNEPSSPLELESPADSVSSWASGDETAFTALGLRRNSFISANLARAGFGPSETFAKWSFVEQRNRRRRFLNRDLGSWRRRLGLVKSLCKRLLDEEAALKAVFR